jgi:DNA ligase-1
MEIDVPYHWVSETLTAISDTTKRTAKLSALTGLFLRLLHHLELCGVQAAPWDGDAGEITNEKKNARRNKAVYVLTCTFDLVLGKLSILKGDSGEDCTATNSTPLQVSGSTVSSAVQTVTGATRMQLRQAYRTSGDLGDCAAQYFQPLSSMKRFFVLSDTDQSTKRSQGSRLTVTRVHETVQEIAVVAVGKGSQKRRQDLIVKLLRSSQDKAELRFLVRTLLGNMRLGATLKSVVAALAHAVVESGSNGAVPGDSVFEDASKALQKVFNVCPRLDRIVAALLTGGISYAVQHCTVEVFHPIQPMLANPAHSLEEVQQFMMLSSSRSNKSEWPAVAEWKYDGVRCQAHFDGVTVKLFSRNLIENTLQYPDVVEYILQAAASSVTSFIIDSELVAVSPSAQARDGFSLLPFQDLSTRRGGNKQGISSGTSICRIQVRIYAFDLIYLNGESLLQLPLRRRRELLMNHFITSDGFGFATSVPITRYDKALLESTLEASVQDGAEGLMIKLTGQSGTSEYGDIADELTQDFGYQSGTRSQLWLKLKRDYLSGEVGGTNTIDVVPVGAWFGMGRKAKNGFLSPVLLAVYDDDEGVFYSIARCMTFSDEMYAAMRGYYFHGTPYPDGVGLGDNESETVDDSASAAVTGEGYDAQSVNVEVASFGQEDDIDAPSRVNCLDTRPPWIVTNESPPIWFKPSEVFEVAFADLSLSTSHTAASTILGETRGRGIALRFPRFKRRRPDKNVEQATSLAEIARLFFQQSKVKSAGKL